MSNSTKSDVQEVSFTLEHSVWPYSLAILTWLGAFAIVSLIALLLGVLSGHGINTLLEGTPLIVGVILGAVTALVCFLFTLAPYALSKKRIYTQQLIERLNLDYVGVSIRDASEWEGELNTNNVVPLRMQSRDGKWLNATAYRSKQRYLSDGFVVCHYILIIDSD